MALIKDSTRVISSLFFLTHIVIAAQFVSSDGDLLKLLVRRSTSEVIVSSSRTLYTLSAGLTVQQTVNYDGQFVMLAQSDVGDHFMWCDNMHCNLTTPNTSILFPTNERDFLYENTASVLSGTLIPQSNPNVVYVHKGENRNTQQIILSTGNISISDSTYTLAGIHDESLAHGFTRRNIVSTLRTDQYIYYIINHVVAYSTDDDDYDDDDVYGTVRLVRICVNDTGITEMDGLGQTSRFLNSYYELKLHCGDIHTQASSAAYYSGVSGSYIFVSFSNFCGHNITCAYNENVISSMITTKFTECTQIEGSLMKSGITIFAQASCIFNDEATVSLLSLSMIIIPNSRG